MMCDFSFLVFCSETESYLNHLFLLAICDAPGAVKVEVWCLVLQPGEGWNLGSTLVLHWDPRWRCGAGEEWEFQLFVVPTESTVVVASYHWDACGSLCLPLSISDSTPAGRVKRSVLLLWGGNGSPGSLLDLCWHHLDKGVGQPFTTLLGWKSWLLICLLLA